MDDKTDSKAAAAQEESRPENNVCFSDRVERTRQSGAGAADAAALSVVSRFGSLVCDATCRGFRAVARLPVKGLLKIGLAAATLVGFAQPADAAYVNFGRAGYYGTYDVSGVWRGGPQISEGQSKFNMDMELGPVEQSLFRSYIFETGNFLPGHIIDRNWYYWLDKWQYYYLDDVQYNLLGGMSYLLGNRFYGAWGGSEPFCWAKEADNFEGTGAAEWFNSRRMHGVLYGPVLGGLGWTPYFGAARDYYERAGVDGYGGWGGELQPGDYIDKVQYYLLDEGQYYYLDKWQYNLMGGWSYILGHVCYPLWYGYGYGPRDDSFGAPVEVLNRQPYRTIYVAQIQGDINYIPEPATVLLLGLGVVMVMRKR